MSTLQKAGLTNHSSFLVLSGLKMSFTLNVITRGQSTTIVLCIGPFLAWWQTNERTTRWSYCRPALDQWEGSLFAILHRSPHFYNQKSQHFLNILASFPSTSKSQSDHVTIQTVSKKNKNKTTITPIWCRGGGCECPLSYWVNIIPHICQFMYITKLFRLVKSSPKNK